MSDSLQPHRRQPTRLCCPWDSPGKNTGVACHFLLQCMKVKSESEVPQSYPILCDPHGLQPTRLLRPWDSPGKSTGVGCQCLLRHMSDMSAKSRTRLSDFTFTFHKNTISWQFMFIMMTLIIKDRLKCNHIFVGKCSLCTQVFWRWVVHLASR